jgi:deoxyribose-phosphate aldolase
MQPAHISLNSDFKNREAILKNPANRTSLAQLLDQTILKPDIQEIHLRQLVEESIQYNFRALCVPSSSVQYAAHTLALQKNRQATPQVCTVIGFPLGHANTAAKVAETYAALKDGADEFDFVQNISWVKDGHWSKLTQECCEIVESANGKLVKVILETSLLSDEEIYNSALAAAHGGVHVLKTSTGFGSRGATRKDLEVINQVVEDFSRQKGSQLGIKASGGIRSLTDALTFIQLGATRIGTSSGIILANGLTNESTSTY